MQSEGEVLLGSLQHRNGNRKKFQHTRQLNPLCHNENSTVSSGHQGTALDLIPAVQGEQQSSPEAVQRHGLA